MAMRTLNRKHRRRERRPLDEDLILSWAYAYLARHETWHLVRSGSIPDSEGDTWQLIDQSCPSIWLRQAEFCRASRPRQRNKNSRIEFAVAHRRPIPEEYAALPTCPFASVVPSTYASNSAAVIADATDQHALLNVMAIHLIIRGVIEAGRTTNPHGSIYPVRPRS
jgi:hypothetical protein